MDNQQGNLQSGLEQFFEKVAYSVGALLGDGCVKSFSYMNKGHLVEEHKVAISNMDKECVERVCGEINLFCNTEYTFREYRNLNKTVMYRLAISNKDIYSFFHYFIGEKLILPDEVFRVNRDAQLAFLAGLFDTDGTIAEHAGYWRIGYAARFRTLVEDVARLMMKLGVKIGKIHEQVSGYGTTMYVIKPNIRSFVDAGCYFYIQRKIMRLYKYMETVKRQGYVKPSETIMPGP